MNQLETLIVNKLHQLILDAEPKAMDAAMSKLTDFFGIIEKRMALVKTEIQNVERAA